MGLELDELELMIILSSIYHAKFGSGVREELLINKNVNELYQKIKTYGEISFPKSQILPMKDSEENDSVVSRMENWLEIKELLNNSRVSDNIVDLYRTAIFPYSSSLSEDEIRRLFE